MAATASLESRFSGSRLGPPCSRVSETSRLFRCHTAVVSVDGDLDAAVLPEFRALLDRALATSAHSVIIDLSEVEFLSLEAASALGPARERACENRLELSVLACSRGVVRALELTGMIALVRSPDTESERARFALPG